jgi:hypothetical protein
MPVAAGDSRSSPMPGKSCSSSATRAVDLFTKDRSPRIELASHAGSLAALTRKKECDRGSGCAAFMPRTRSTQLAEGVVAIAANQETAMAETSASDCERVRDIRQFRSPDLHRGDRRSRARRLVQRRHRTGRQHEQERRLRRFDRRRGRSLLKDRMRVGAADAE